MVSVARALRDHQHVPLLHEFVHLLLQQRSAALGANVFDRGNQARSAETIGPIAAALPAQ